MGKVQVSRAAAALALLGLFLGLWGIRWGLPGPQRLARVMPPGLEGPAFQQTLADSWSSMHAELGENMMLNPKSFSTFTGIVETPAGWKTPPKELLNSYRSFHVRTEHEDEQSIMLALARIKPRQLQFSTHMFTYGTLHVYMVGATMVLGAATGLVTLKNSVLYYLADPPKMAAMYLAGRLLTVAAFVGCGLMLLRLGRKYLSVEAGALGAAVFLMTPAAVVQAHVLKPHTVWTFFLLCALERTLRVLKTGALKDYAVAGALSGLTTAAFLGAWPYCFIVGAAGGLRLAGWHEPKGRPRPPAAEIQGVLLAALCAIAVFLAVNPYWIMDFGEAMQEMKVLSGFSAVDPTHPFLFIANALRRGVTNPVLVVMFAGTALAFVKGRREPALLLCAAGFVIALAAMSTVGGVISTRQVRYFLGGVALGSLLAGRLLQEIRALKGTAGKIGAAAAAIFMLGLGAQGFSYAYSFRLSEGARSNHFLSGEWIEKNIPEGSQIGLLRLPQPSNSPYFRYDRYRLKFIEPKLAPGLPPAALPRYLAVTVPDYDDRPSLAPILSRYELLASFPRAKLFPWIEIDPSSMTANPVIEIYGLKAKNA